MGDGPVYVVGHGWEATVGLRSTVAYGGWWYWKVIWIREPEFTGPVLVRGRQLDGPNELRFSSSIGDANPSSEMRLLFRSSWLEGVGPRYIRMRAPGCYAYQVDGAAFSKVIVFQAVDADPRL